MGISIFPEPVCCICLDADATVLLVPCYHKQFCKGCIQSQENT